MTNEHTEQEKRYFPVRISTLRLTEVTAFDLYIQPNADKSPVLYRKADKPFSEEARVRLTEYNVEFLLISSDQQTLYQDYLETNLPAILNDTTIPTHERASALYNSAQGLVKDALTNTPARRIVERSGNLVEHMVDYIFHDSRVFQSLMKVTSFDYYTYTHSVNTFIFSTVLAQRLGFKESSIRELGQGTLLHDIGKSRIDPEILNSREKLTAEQWVEMKKHPGYGCEILEAEGGASDVVLDIVLHHHEKLDGSGYPHALSGDEISRWARIAAIVDIFDALTTQRSYKSAIGSFSCLKFMLGNMADELDKEFLRVFVGMMGQSPTTRKTLLTKETLTPKPG
jgi:HD-GYP domain-containing protein (c-di-GMP phosphodiesterase class II)